MMIKKQAKKAKLTLRQQFEIAMKDSLEKDLLTPEALMFMDKAIRALVNQLVIDKKLRKEVYFFCLSDACRFWKRLKTIDTTQISIFTYMVTVFKSSAASKNT